MTFKDLVYQKADKTYFIDDVGFNGVRFKGYVLLDISSPSNCEDCMFKNHRSLDCFHICSDVNRSDKCNVIIRKIEDLNDNDNSIKNCSICKHYNSNGECDASMKPLSNCIVKEFILFKDFNEDS